MKIAPNLVRFQIGIFFGEPIMRIDRVGQKIKDRFSDVFTGPPLILPIPEAILDIPVMQIASDDKNWSMSFSRKRADLTLELEDGVTSYESIAEKEKLTEVVNVVLDEIKEKDIKIFRFTNITTYAVYVDNPTEFIVDLLFNDKFKGQNIAELTINSNTPVEEDNVNYNNITIIEGGKTKLDDKSVIFITKDFNTDPKKKNEFDVTDFPTFLKHTIKYSSWEEIRKSLIS